jgi:hypothetical protein
MSLIWKDIMIETVWLNVIISLLLLWQSRNFSGRCFWEKFGKSDYLLEEKETRDSVSFFLSENLDSFIFSRAFNRQHWSNNQNWSIKCSFWWKEILVWFILRQNSTSFSHSLRWKDSLPMIYCILLRLICD